MKLFTTYLETFFRFTPHRERSSAFQHNLSILPTCSLQRILALGQEASYCMKTSARAGSKIFPTVPDFPDCKQAEALCFKEKVVRIYAVGANDWPWTEPRKLTSGACFNPRIKAGMMNICQAQQCVWQRYIYISSWGNHTYKSDCKTNGSAFIPAEHLQFWKCTSCSTTRKKKKTYTLNGRKSSHNNFADLDHKIAKP